MSNISTGVCHDHYIDLPLALHGSLLFAVGITLSLAFLQKRKRKWPDCCDGRPGVVVPVNLLDDFENRWSCACGFGAITNVIVSIFVSGIEANSLILKVFVALVYSGEVCVVFFPFFACLITPHKRIGSIIGLVYSGAWFLIMLVATIQCLNPIPDIIPFMGLVLQLPSLICLGFLTGKFAKVTYDIYQLRKMPRIEPEVKLVSDYQMSYVRHLMTKHKMVSTENPPATCMEKFKHFLSKHIYENKPHFKYSTRMVCTMFVAVSCTVELGLIIYVTVSHHYKVLLKSVDEKLNRSGWDPDSLNETGTKWKEAIQTSLCALYVGYSIVTLLVVLYMTFSIFAILAKYRMNMLQLYKGDYSFFPNAYKYNATHTTVRFCLSYSGYQIAYYLYGYFIMLLAFNIFYLLFIIFIVLPLALGLDVLILLLEVILLPVLVSLFLRYSQELLARFFFLQDKVSETDPAKPLAVANRRQYHIMNYFFFIANIAMGLFSAMFRMLLSAMVGVVFLGRIDRCVLVPGFETNDKGFMSYLGMLLVEHTHNNPVLRVFCHQMINTIVKGVKTGQADSGFTNINYASEQMSKTEHHDQPKVTSMEQRVKKRVQRKWLLLLTLHNNPDIIPLRKHHIEEDTKTKQELSDKLIKIFKSGLLGITPDSVSTSRSGANGNAHLRALVAKQHQERANVGGEKMADNTAKIEMSGFVESDT